MVYTIIKKHNGFVKVYSEPSRGSKFCVYIPKVSEQKGMEEIDIRNKELLKGSGTILVIDDESIIRKLALNVLEDCGYTVLTAEHGVEGLEVFKEKKEQIKMVILDMNMPFMHGSEVYDALKEIKEDLKILVSFGLNYESLSYSKKGIVIDAFISKPFRAYDLSRKVCDLLKDRSQE